MGRNRRYSEKRKEEALRMDEIAREYYREEWDVKNIRDLEGESNEEYPKEDKDKTDVHILDYLGADKLVDLGDEIILLAHRFRPYESGNDFSLRTDNGTGMGAEYEKCLNGLRNVGSYPSVYAFGNKNENNDGFENFYLIDFHVFLVQVELGEISGEEHHGRDNTSAIYFDMEDVKDKGCVIAKWE